MVVAGENPSFDYYFAPRFALHQGPPVERLDISAQPRDLAERDWAGVFVILCRYVSRAWLDVLSINAEVLSGVALFVDDDMAALASDPSSPVWYRRKLRRLAIDRWPQLAPLLTTVWVSTPILSDRWKAMKPSILPPLADTIDLAAAPAPAPHLLVGLHATGSHKADQQWLQPVVRAVLAANQDVTFEVVTDRAQASKWRGDRRVRVLSPLPWPAYRAETAERARDLLLAPHLPTPANAARAGVKRIDAVRCGATLLVSDSAAYRVSDEEAVLNMSLPLDVDAWIAGIIHLLGDANHRRALAELNRTQLVQARRAAGPLFVAARSGEGDVWRLA